MTEMSLCNRLCGLGVSLFVFDFDECIPTSTCFGQFLCPSSGVFHCTHNNGICHTGLLTDCEQDQDGTPSWSCSQAVWRTIVVCTMKNSWWWTEELSETCRVLFQETCRVLFQKEIEKLVHLVGFIVRIFLQCCTNQVNCTVIYVMYQLTALYRCTYQIM